MTLMKGRNLVLGYEDQVVVSDLSFEVESGDRMEFELRGSEYGLLAEGDLGKLTFQGTRYLGFERG